MRADDHALIRADLSARLDGEVSDEIAAWLDDHLATCSECRAYLARLESVRALVRVQPLPDDVPDLAPAVMRAVHEAAPRYRMRELWVLRLRIASVAAAAAAFVLLGAILPFGDGPSDIATADAIADDVRAAARTALTYRARMDLIERGWHPQVGTRRFTADVSFRSPESLHLVMTDRTSYPGVDWPTNDYELVANPGRWWIEENSTCPTQGLPACAAPTTWAGVVERRTVFNRQPFDGTTPLPTDMIVPLETFAADGTFDVVGPDRVLDRPAVRVRFDYRNAKPLVDALQVGGSWRPFHPLDQVDVWLDRATSFPLRFEVTQARSPDRAAWAQRFGIVEPRSQPLLAVTTSAIEEPASLTSASFRAPRGGLSRNAGFEVAGLSTRRSIDVPFGFELYRSGLSHRQEIRAYTDGITYLKVITQPRGQAAPPVTAEEIRIGTRWTYYRPASLEAGRRIDMFGTRRHVRIESNMTRAEMLEIAKTVRSVGRRFPTVVHRPGGVTIERLPSSPEGSFERPSYLPVGYEAAVVLRTRIRATETLTVYYRSPEAEFEGDGIRVVQTSPMRLLPPSSEEFLNVSVDGFAARWSVERGELEWLDGTTYRAVAVPSGDLTTAVAIAQSL